MAVKRSMQDVDYRRGRGRQQCCYCSMYVKHNAKAEFGTCTAVAGKISPFGTCYLWAGIPNPFGEGGEYRHLNDDRPSIR